MNSKALYWIALGVFALGLNSEYQKGNLPLAHRVAGQAQSVMCRIATRAEQTWALAQVLTGRQEFTATDRFMARQQAEIDRVMAENQAELNRAMALRQADLDRMQQKLDRVHIVLDQVQLNKTRILERTQFRLSNAVTPRFEICPHTGTRVTVAPPDEADLNVEVDETQ